MRDIHELLEKSAAEIARAEGLIEFHRRAIVKAHELFDSYGLDPQAWRLRCTSEVLGVEPEDQASVPGGSTLQTRRRMRRLMV